ncbi:hypothetical protein BDV10DRAFT_186265 [Aspergillus recurvatus]
MNRDVAIGMYLAIFGSVLILVAMWLTNGFSRITETCSFCRSRSCSRNRDRSRRASDEQRELEGETELQTLRSCSLPRAECRPSGIQPPFVREEHTSAYFYGWYLPYNVRGPSQTEPEPEPEVEHEDLPPYEHPPAYAQARPSTEVRGRESSSHREPLDVTARRQAPGPHNESGNVAATRHRGELENARRSPHVTEHRMPLDVV